MPADVPGITDEQAAATPGGGDTAPASPPRETAPGSSPDSPPTADDLAAQGLPTPPAPVPGDPDGGGTRLSPLRRPVFGRSGNGRESQAWGGEQAAGPTPPPSGAPGGAPAVAPSGPASPAAGPAAPGGALTGRPGEPSAPTGGPTAPDTGAGPTATTETAGASTPAAPVVDPYAPSHGPGGPGGPGTIVPGGAGLPGAGVPGPVVPGPVPGIGEPPPAPVLRPSRPRAHLRLRSRTGSARAARAARRGLRVDQRLWHINLWSVFKLSALFYLCLGLVLLVAGTLLYNAGREVGTIDQFESFITRMGAYGDCVPTAEVPAGTEFEEDESCDEGTVLVGGFVLDDGTLFRVAAIGGAVLVVGGAIGNVLLTILVTLLNEVNGGLRHTIIREPVVRPPGSGPGPGQPGRPGPGSGQRRRPPRPVGVATGDGAGRPPGHGSGSPVPRVRQ
jgi:Transmembrane domain of unknown function (DUF3566)